MSQLTVIAELVSGVLFLIIIIPSLAALMTESSGPSDKPQEQIRLRAHHLYEQRGKAAGQALDDWLQAEVEILKENQATVERAPDF